MKKHFIHVAFVAFLFTPAFASAQPVFNETTYVSGLNQPTAMAFAPNVDGNTRLFVSEKPGSLRVVKNGTLLMTPFLSLSVNSSSERGLLGIAFDPSFATNHFVYAYYTRSASPIKNRVSRFTADATFDSAVSGSEVVLLDNIPSDAGNHNGGALHFGLDGKLYISTGDGGQTHTNAQLLSSLSGKILRINPDGTIPSDNPFLTTTGARGEVWAYGLRNPFTFDVDPTSGKMYINDVGELTWEEINLGVRGANYGWPTCEGPQNTGVGNCTSSSFTYPIHSYDHSLGDAIAGGAFYRGTQFPQYQGSYFFGDYVAGWIRELTTSNTANAFRTAASPVDIRVGADGALYYISIDTGSIKKIQYGDGTPTCTLANSTDGTIQLGTSALFSASGGDGIFSWSAPEGSPASGTGPTFTSLYTNLGKFTVTVTSASASATCNVNVVTGTPPVGIITTPDIGTAYNAGDTITYSGVGTDVEDGTLPESAFSWTIVFHHDTHTHPFLGPIVGAKSGSFVIPQIGEISSNVFYQINLAVTDSSGRTYTVSRNVIPHTVTLTGASNPNGLQITVNGQPQVTPYTFVSVVGMNHELDTVTPQTLGAQAYFFQDWSDGGTKAHTITAPGVTTSYTASFIASGTPIITPSITGTVTTASTAVNLTTTGTSDWAHWYGYDHKAAGGSQISRYTVVGVGTVSNYANDLRTMSWSDGTPTISGSNKNGIYISGTGKGFSFTAPADTTTRTLNVYAGGWKSGGKLTAHLSDGSAPDYINTVPQSATGQYNGNWTITYTAASSGQHITVSWVQNSGTGNVTLNGATLSHPLPDP